MVSFYTGCLPRMRCIYSLGEINGLKGPWVLSLENAIEHINPPIKSGLFEVLTVKRLPAALPLAFKMETENMLH